MDWSHKANDYVKALKPVQETDALRTRLISLIDLTSLNEGDTAESVALLLAKARCDYGHVAAVCLYPQFVELAATEFAGTPVKVATVANFPGGDQPLETVIAEMNQAIDAGASEIDVVFPYTRYLAFDRDFARTFVSTCKAACGNKVTLKVILETGVLKDAAIIADASKDAIFAGADFIKTSTGKAAQGVTVEAAAVMLLVIKQLSDQLKRPIGFKVSGGIREIQEAARYVELADLILGREKVTPKTFRIGASKLIEQF